MLYCTNNEGSYVRTGQLITPKKELTQGIVTSNENMALE